MPVTVNGIGTRYCGKVDLQARPGICQHCRHEVELQSYQTRLWFTILYIPILPLGRKQILDLCPRCQRHRAMPLDEWHTFTEQTVKEAVEGAAKDPQDPQSGIQLHGTLAAFGRREEAQGLAELMTTRFPDHAGVQLHLGVWHAEEGRLEEADRRFDRALELEPENRDAMRAVGIRRIEQGEPDLAAELLAFMKEPGPDQDPAVLVLLADAYRDRGGNQEALDFYRIALTGAPHLARDGALRKRVKACETALGGKDTLLPKLPLNRLLVFGVPALAAAALVAVLLINRSIAFRQTLHVVNRLPKAVSVTIDDEVERTVGPGARDKVVLAEGVHRAVITREGRVPETVDFQMRNGFFERFGRDTVFVLDPGGAAIFLWQETVYAANPDPAAAAPHRIHYGRSFHVFRDIDYVFRDFPPRLAAQSSRLRRTRVVVIEGTPAEILQAFPQGTLPGQYMEFIEHYLKLDPADEALLQMYYPLAANAGLLERCCAFLGKGIVRRPVVTEWHRMYQEAEKAAGREGKLIAQYDEMLAPHSDDSALLYLRGRIEPEAASAIGFYDRAIAADRDNPYPLYARAYHLVSRGRYVEARELCATACRLAPEHAGFALLLFETRFALGEYAALADEARREQTDMPLSPSHHTRLLRVLVATGETAEAEKAQLAYVDNAKATAPAYAERLAAHGELSLRYLRGDLQGYSELAEKLTDPSVATAARITARFEQGDLEEVEKLLAENMEEQTGYLSLLLSIAWSRKGNAQKALQWRQKADEAFAEGSLEERLIPGMLAKGDAVAPAEVDELALERRLKVILLVALADGAPVARKQLLARAERLNLLDLFPYQFLKRTIAAMGG